jgi:hypothetical protein
MNNMLEVMYVSRAGLHERLVRGDRCFAVLEQGTILSFFWIRRGERYLPELHLKFNLGTHQVWMYNAVTVKRARGRGLCPNIICHIAQALGQENTDELFVEAEEGNQASLHAIEKANCKRIVRIRLQRIISMPKYYLQIYDKVAWEELAKTIENFDNIRWIIEGKA